MNSNSKYVNREEKLDFSKVYHIYNKSIGNELLFREKSDYYFFLRKFERYILPIAEIYAYCLMPNHFHLLLKIRPEEDVIKNLNKISNDTGVKVLHQTFSNFLNSYAKSYNKAHKRAGRLFLYSFKRILVYKEDYLFTLINYIHRNPIHHRFVNNFADWDYSSYNEIISNETTIISRDFVLSYFASIDEFIVFHKQNKTTPESEKYLLE